MKNILVVLSLFVCAFAGAASIDCYDGNNLTSFGSKDAKWWVIDHLGNRTLAETVKILDSEVRQLEGTDMATQYIYKLQGGQRLSVTFPMGVTIAVGYMSDMPVACQLK